MSRDEMTALWFVSHFFFAEVKSNVLGFFRVDEKSVAQGNEGILNIRHDHHLSRLQSRLETSGQYDNMVIASPMRLTLQL